MEYNEIQEKIERVRRALESEWDGSSTEILKEQTSDEPEEARRGIYAHYWKFGTSTPVAAKRTAIVEFMMNKTAEETPMLRGQLLKWLQDFRKEDFNKEARAKLDSLPWNEDFAPEVIRIIGVAELTEAIPRLQEQVKNQPLGGPPPPGYEKSNTWAAMLALARMGENTSLSNVLKYVQREKNIVIRATVLFDDLGYTHRSAAFDLLKKYVNSGERLPQIKDNVPGTLEASRAAAVFAKHVVGFPIQETDLNERETMQARSWINAQTSWQFK